MYQNENDTIEIYYAPNLKLPELYYINASKDTVFIKLDQEKKYKNFVTFPQFIRDKDSTLLNNTDQLYFIVAVNWNGEIFAIKAKSHWEI